jgi:hypothetical protein
VPLKLYLNQETWSIRQQFKKRKLLLRGLPCTSEFGEQIGPDTHMPGISNLMTWMEVDFAGAFL